MSYVNAWLKRCLLSRFELGTIWTIMELT